MQPGDLVKIHGDKSGEVHLLLNKKLVEMHGESRVLCILDSPKGELKTWQYDLEKVSL